MKRATILFSFGREDLTSLNLFELAPLTERLQVLWDGGFFEYRYDEEMKMILPVRGNYRLFETIPMMPHEPRSFIQSLLLSPLPLALALEVPIEKAKSTLLPPIDKARCTFKWFYDYPAMITALYESGKILIRQSTNILASDPRKFSFDDDREYEVDCLGLTSFEDLSQKVRELWKTC